MRPSRAVRRRRARAARRRRSRAVRRFARRAAWAAAAVTPSAVLLRSARVPLGMFAAGLAIGIAVALVVLAAIGLTGLRRSAERAGRRAYRAAWVTANRPGKRLPRPERTRIHDTAVHDSDYTERGA